MTFSNWLLITWHSFWAWAHSLEAAQAHQAGNRAWFISAKNKAHTAQRKASVIRNNAVYGSLR